MSTSSTRRRSALVAAIISLASVIGLVVGAGGAAAAPLAPVAKLDLTRYVGVWNQVAAIPAPFNIDCLRNTQARYTKLSDIDIKVENSCTPLVGPRRTIVGNARLNDKKTNAALHVSFPSVPFMNSKDGPSNYIVSYIAPDYSWALVGSSERLSGFVLKRDKQVNASQWKQIKQVVSSRGYNTCFFLTTPIDGAYPNTQPLCTVR
ncbi:lipocalin family protein [Williamsia sp. CHRR-6]|uniref:lipocalin family protein n=1 Tax=Williamsia sp. CHRR-6 TaxID=2835871 RepID=UPI001BD995AA|nr:lipocalin family protein [Williamsia sp. CHRR-6]MBT0567290.1 lipocalin family protein [Williamsia sp. CHRR-6]